MIEIEVSAAGARLLQSEVLTSGRVGLRCRLRFDSSWDGLLKTAIVVGSRSADLLLQDGEFTVPAECLGRAGDSLKIGLRGTNGDGSLVIPTVWVNCGEILSGAELSQQPAQEQTRSLLAQIMDQAAQDGAAFNVQTFAEAFTGLIGSDANMRTEPGENGEIITTLSEDTTVMITGETDEWYQVTYEGTTGYISKGLFK